MKKIIIWVLAALSLISLSACANGKSSQKDNRNLLTSPINKDVTTMGTYIKVTVYDKGKEAAVEKALKLPVEYNNLTTVNQSGSQIDEINQNAGIKPIKVNSNVYELVKAGYNYSAKDLGYDITIGSLTSLWNIGMDNARKPAQSEIDQVLPLINYHDIKFDDKNETIYLTQKGARLDLGSIVKGFVAMKMVDSLKKDGVTTGIVNLGSSSIYVIGHSPRGADSPWTIGIKNPNDPTGTQMGIIKASNEHVNTSGIYERYLEVDGHKYSHILNPKTGYPFENDIASITLLISGKDKTNGDGLSTMIYAMGTKKGYEYVEKLKNVEAVFVDKDNKVLITPGLKDKFQLSDKKTFEVSNITKLK